jgi:hypothetical protein
MVTPTASMPQRTAKAVATALSTPPLIAARQVPTLVSRGAAERVAGGLSAITECMRIDWGEQYSRGQTQSVSNSFQRRCAHLIPRRFATLPLSTAGPGRVFVLENTRSFLRTP